MDERRTTATAVHMGYVIPEFPGQTHVWMWREIHAMRDWGVPLTIYSTRRPSSRDRARHAFADAAERETTYLWPKGIVSLASDSIWGLGRPRRIWRCLRLAWTLPGTERFRRMRRIALILPALGLARRVAIAGVTHMHSHTCSNSAILCMMVRRLIEVPFSMTLNANLDWWGGGMQEKLEDAEFTLAVSRRLVAQTREAHPALGPDKVELGRIGVDTRKWIPPPRTKPSEGPLSAVIVARLHRTKGHDVLLDAVALLRDRRVPILLHVIGDGPERRTLEEQAVRLSIAGQVTFHGSLGEEQIIERMRAADIFVLPSRYEPLGVAYMEAMSMQLATVGTTAGGVAEIIDHDVDGLLVPPDDPRQLADTLDRLAADPGLRHRLGVAGRRKIMAEFDSRVGAATLYTRVHGHPPRADAGAVPTEG